MTVLKKINIFQILKGLFVSLSLFLLLIGTIQIPASAQKISDLNILGIKCIFPGQSGCNGSNLFDNVTEFLLNLAPVLAVFVITWGGYQYFFGALGTGQAEGKKTIIAGVIGLVVVLSARAVQTVIKGSVTESGLSTQPLTDFIGSGTDYLFAVVSVIAVLVIVWGGYKYLFSGLPGDQKNGLDTIRNGIIGLVIVLLANPIKSLITGTIIGGDNLNLDTAPIIRDTTTLIAGFLIPVSTVAAVIFIVLGAYYYISSNGDEAQAKKGKQALINAVIGLAIALLATTITQLVVFFVPTL